MDAQGARHLHIHDIGIRAVCWWCANFERSNELGKQLARVEVETEIACREEYLVARLEGVNLAPLALHVHWSSACAPW